MMIPRSKHSLQDAIRKSYAKLRTELEQNLAPISDLPELHEADDYLTLCRKLDETVECVQLLIESKTNAQLYVESWYKQWPLGRMIQFNTSSPYANATKRIRKWKKIRTQQEQLP